jgi:hypothetical protein
MSYEPLPNEEIIPDEELSMQWGVKEITVNGKTYPEVIMAEVTPDYYENNGEPCFVGDDIDDTDPDYHPSMDADGPMEYLRTVRIKKENT